VLGTPCRADRRRQLGFTYLPFMHRIFEARPVALGDGLLVIGVGIALLFVVEVEKWIRRKIAGKG
jgi:hypothetical protein